MAKNVAMQAAALKPLYTSESEVDAAYIEKEKEILTVAAKNEKPDANDKIINGMVMGRIKKELKEICLLDQVYVKAEDGKQSVAVRCLRCQGQQRQHHHQEVCSFRDRRGH